MILMSSATNAHIIYTSMAILIKLIIYSELLSGATQLSYSCSILAPPHTHVCVCVYKIINNYIHFLSQINLTNSFIPERLVPGLC
jgi:hypothetical protein